MNIHEIIGMTMFSRLLMRRNKTWGVGLHERKLDSSTEGSSGLP